MAFEQFDYVVVGAGSAGCAVAIHLLNDLAQKVLLTISQCRIGTRDQLNEAQSLIIEA